MTRPPATAKRSDRLYDDMATYTAISLSLFPVLVLLRAYEFTLTRQLHVLSDGMVMLTLQALRSDVGVVLWTAAILVFPILALARWSVRAAVQLHRALLVALVVVSVALIQFFTVTFVPLGADLFGYSPRDLRETVMSSKGVGIASFAGFVGFAVLTWFVSGLARRVRIPRLMVAGFFATIALSVVFPITVSLAPRAFANDGAYFLSENTAAYFFGHSARYFVDRAAALTSRSQQGYPLLHRSSNEDVLGPFLTRNAQRPNFVFVIVEGLGQDFVGDRAPYGGFTPFIDSLAHHGLYWDNFLSTSGRTFGVLPSMFASLPPTDGGFLELGARMPRHLSLIQLLKQRGYRTQYFSGTDGHFDLIDVFLERQGIDSLIDATKFGAGYEKEPSGTGGFTWGYGDAELFRRSFASLGSVAQPRLDIYLTVSTHEPFIPPREPEYRARVDARLAAMKIDPARREEYRSYANVFETLQYTDDALRDFIHEYAKRPDFGRTIFIITGDHRLIPLPPATRADRFRVPFIIFSPMVKAPQRFGSVSTHMDVTPSLLALLQHNYALTFPDSVAWVGTGLDTARAFRNTHVTPLMRTKGQIDEYIDGEYFLSGDQLFRLTDGFDLPRVDDEQTFRALHSKLARAIEVGRYVTSQDRLYPATAADSAARRLRQQEDSVMTKLAITGKTPDELFALARSKALAGDYDTSRIICSKLLRDIPNFHDARALLGRTYAWQRRFDEARPILAELVRRAPDYPDGYVASMDVELWSGHGEVALLIARNALSRFPGNADLIAGQARARALIAGGGAK